MVLNSCQGKMACNFKAGENVRIQQYQLKSIILKEELFSSERIKIKELMQVRRGRVVIFSHQQRNQKANRQTSFPMTEDGTLYEITYSELRKIYYQDNKIQTMSLALLIVIRRKLQSILFCTELTVVKQEPKPETYVLGSYTL